MEKDFNFIKELGDKELLDLYDKIIEHIQYLKENIIVISDGGDSSNVSN